jgi:hypothetical protein
MLHMTMMMSLVNFRLSISEKVRGTIEEKKTSGLVHLVLSHTTRVLAENQAKGVTGHSHSQRALEIQSTAFDWEPVPSH